MVDIYWYSPLFLMDLQILKVTSSLFNRNFTSPFSITIKALPVARNGLRRIETPQNQPHNPESQNRSKI